MRELQATCTQCDGVGRVGVDAGVHDRYLLREGVVQTMFPTLTLDEREVIINADPPHQRGFAYYVCAECWPKVMGERITVV